mgnify:CR=1 FL=1
MLMNLMNYGHLAENPLPVGPIVGVIVLVVVGFFVYRYYKGKNTPPTRPLDR